ELAGLHQVIGGELSRGVVGGEIERTGVVADHAVGAEGGGEAGDAAADAGEPFGGDARIIAPGELGEGLLLEKGEEALAVGLVAGGGVRWVGAGPLVAPADGEAQLGVVGL